MTLQDYIAEFDIDMEATEAQKTTWLKLSIQI